MCGIIGYHNYSHKDFNSLLQLLKHRGPDSQGFVQVGNATMGHTRLSIIDVSNRAYQPYLYNDTVLTFNGEIWNYIELKKVLSVVGYSFDTLSDTEVLSKWLHHKGMDGLRDVDGMFAFAYWDSSNLFLASDKWGEIPLYVYKAGSSFFWASEKKALLGFNFKSVHTFLPGTYYNVSSNKSVEYYSAEKSTSNEDLSASFNAAVNKRLMIADVPVCCLISGGLDSSMILALAKKLHPDIVAYTAVLNPNSPDYKFAKKICSDLNVPLKPVFVTPPTLLDIDKVIRTIEIDSKAQIEIGLMCMPLAEQIQKDGFKVCLSGEGADELFGGYGNTAIKYNSLSESGYRDEKLFLLRKMTRGNFPRTNKIFMHHSIEARLPFLDNRVVEWAINNGKNNNPIGKKALKNLAKNLVPDYVINRPKDTFQGSAGMPDHVAKLLSNPVKYYNARCKKMYG